MIQHNNGGWRIRLTLLLQGLSEDRNSGVDRVGDDKEHSLGASSGTSLSQTLDNAGVGVEQIISGHSRLSGDTGRDDNNVGTIQSLTSLLHTDEASNLSLRVAVRNISSNTVGSHNIEQVELGDARIQLEEKRQRLSNSTAGTQDGDLETSLRLSGNSSADSTSEHFRPNG